MDVALLIRHRLKELGLEQKDLAAAAEVTESYISQLLARKKAPPAPGRTDIYEKIGKFLKLASGELSNLAELQRNQELRKRVAEPPGPLFKECRELILRKCNSGTRSELQRIFEKEPFGELERLVTQKLLDVAQGNQESIDVFSVPVEKRVSLLESTIESWDIDLKTFGMGVALNPRVAPRSLKRIEFSEQTPERSFAIEPGLEQFLTDQSLSGDATEEEIEFLKALKFRGKQPSPIYYYRELQNLRDPLHFSVIS
jgi:transcriptional regulator with XRE-family HTH domain